MTQKNSLSTEEKVPVEDTKQADNATSPQNKSGPRKFWGTITLAVLTALVTAYSLSVALLLPQTPVTYIASVLYTLIVAGFIASIVLTIRGNQGLGAKFAFYMTLALGTTVIAVTQGLTTHTSFSILIIGIIATFGLFPKESRRRYLAIIVAVFALVWIIEWINPPWRVGEVEAETFGEEISIGFGLVLGYFTLRRVIGKVFTIPQVMKPSPRHQVGNCPQDADTIGECVEFAFATFTTVLEGDTDLSRGHLQFQCMYGQLRFNLETT